MHIINTWQELVLQKEKISILTMDTSSIWILCSFFEVELSREQKISYKIKRAYKIEELGYRNSFQKLGGYLKYIFNEFSLPELVVVGLGPGSFTGVRIAVSTARTLSQLLKIPVIGLDSLSLYGYSISKQYNINQFYVGIDAKQNKYFIKLFDENVLINPIMDYKIEDIENILKYDFIYIDQFSTFLKRENIKGDFNKIQLIEVIDSTSWLDIMFSTYFIENSHHFFRTHYSEILPIYIRTDPAHEKFPEGLKQK